MSKRILIADDDDDALVGLAHLLDGMRHEVALAPNGARAIEVAGQFAPIADGLAAAQQALRALPNGAAMLLVALTG